MADRVSLLALPPGERFICQRGWMKAGFDACMHGMFSQRPSCEGIRLKTPWSVMVNFVELTKVLNPTCDRSHGHAIVMSSDTEWADGYSFEVFDMIHRA